MAKRVGLGRVALLDVDSNKLTSASSLKKGPKLFASKGMRARRVSVSARPKPSDLANVNGKNPAPARSSSQRRGSVGTGRTTEARKVGLSRSRRRASVAGARPTRAGVSPASDKKTAPRRASSAQRPLASGHQQTTASALRKKRSAPVKATDPTVAAIAAAGAEEVAAAQSTHAHTPVVSAKSRRHATSGNRSEAATPPVAPHASSGAPAVPGRNATAAHQRSDSNSRPRLGSSSSSRCSPQSIADSVCSPISVPRPALTSPGSPALLASPARRASPMASPISTGSAAGMPGSAPRSAASMERQLAAAKAMTTQLRLKLRNLVKENERQQEEGVAMYEAYNAKCEKLKTVSGQFEELQAVVVAQDKELARQREAAAQSTAAASPAAARASRSSIGTSPMAVPSAHGNTACGTPVAELRRSRNESVARIEELEAKIASLQAANVRSPRASLGSQRSGRTSTGSGNSAASSPSTMAIRYDLLREEMEGMASKCKAAESELAAATESAAKALAAKSEADAALQQAQAELKSLKASTAEASKESKDSMEKMKNHFKSQIAKLRKDISQKANETKRLQLQLHKAKGANEDETTAEIEALRKDKATLASKLKRAKAMAASAEEAVAKSQEELKAQLAAKDEEFAAATAAAEATTTKQAATVANLESDLKLMYKRHKSELAELKRQLKTNAYETRLAELVAENQRLSDTLQGLEGLIPDLERVADLQQQYDVELLQARGAQARLTSGGTTLRQQRAELSEAQATIAKLEAQLEASELARVEAVVNSTADVLAEACLGQVLTSSCDHVERNTMAMEREAVASEVANLRACMQAAAVEKAEREEFAAMEQQVLTEALEEARKQVDDAQQQVATLTAQVEGAKAAAAEAEQRARAASSAREAQQETSASNAAEIASLKTIADTAREDLAASSARVTGLQAELDAVCAQLDTSAQREQLLRQELAAAQQGVAELERKLDAEKSAAEEAAAAAATSLLAAQERADAAEQEVASTSAQLQVEIAEANAKAAAATRAAATLKAEVDEAKEDCAGLREQLQGTQAAAAEQPSCESVATMTDPVATPAAADGTSDVAMLEKRVQELTLDKETLVAQLDELCDQLDCDDEDSEDDADNAGGGGGEQSKPHRLLVAKFAAERAAAEAQRKVADLQQQLVAATKSGEEHRNYVLMYKQRADEKIQALQTALTEAEADADTAETLLVNVRGELAAFTASASDAPGLERLTKLLAQVEASVPAQSL